MGKPIRKPRAEGQCEQVAVASLVLDPHNVRKHGERNVQVIAASLSRFGQQKPIVIDAKNKVVAGNGTVEAARLLKWSTILAIRTSLNEHNATAFAIADNRSAELSEWNYANLIETLSDFKDHELGAGLGFTENELAALKGLVDLDMPGADPLSPQARSTVMTISIQDPQAIGDIEMAVRRALEGFDGKCRITRKG